MNFEDERSRDHDDGGPLDPLCDLCLNHSFGELSDFLPVDGNVVAYSVLISIMLGTTVFSKSYTIEDAVFPLAMSFYVGFGFNALLDARIAGLDKALFGLVYRLGDRQWCLSCWDELW